MRKRFILLAGLLVVLLVSLGSAILAQEVPPPYTGLKNLFPWEDKAAQEAGKAIYQRACLACHGATGTALKDFDFSTAESAKHLEERPDLHFWVLTEGNLAKGMPPYKSSLSDEQRWHTLTYIWSLGKAPSPAAPSLQPTSTPAAPTTGKMEVVVPAKAMSGQELTVVASLQDDAGKPLGNVPIRFFIDVNFFTQALMAIGEATTNDKGIAELKFASRLVGRTEVIARYQTIEGRASIDLAEVTRPFYETEAGLKPPPAGEDIFIGPEGSKELLGMGNAPQSALRLPGGGTSWLLLFIGVLALVWGAYFWVMRLIYGIPAAGGPAVDPLARRFPFLALVLITIAAIIMILMVATGPYSHFHLHP